MSSQLIRKSADGLTSPGDSGEGVTGESRSHDMLSSSPATSASGESDSSVEGDSSRGSAANASGGAQLKVIAGGLNVPANDASVQVPSDPLLASAENQIRSGEEPHRADSSTAELNESAEANGTAEPKPSAAYEAPITLPGSGIRINIGIFSGPMDLLLHLVQQQEVDISRVSMKLVAEQYLLVVSELMKQLDSQSLHSLSYDLEQVSEFLVIAATLTAIKSSALLPTSNSEGLHEVVDPQSEEFLEELRERLRVYEQTKQRAARLTALPQLGVDTFTRVDRKTLLPTPEMLAEPDDAQSLGEHLTRLLKRIGSAGRVFRVKLESVSIVSSMMRVVDFFNSERLQGSFLSLLRTFGKERPVVGADGARVLVIGSFLAVLELVKRGVLSANQEGDGKDIRLELRSGEQNKQDGSTSTTFESEFDEVPAAKEVNSGY